MWSPLSRPDLAQYERLPKLPDATDESPVSVTFLGVTSLLFQSGKSAILTDGYFTRAGKRTVLTSVLAKRLSSRDDAIDAGLRAAGVEVLDAVLPVHTHFDHALDSAAVAQRTKSVLVGGESAANIARGGGLPEINHSDPRPAYVTIADGSETRHGDFRVEHVLSRHSRLNLVPGTIKRPLRQPAHVWSYRCGEAWSLLIRHGDPPHERTALVHGSAGFEPRALRERSADVIYLGVGQLGRKPKRSIERYWAETVRAVRQHPLVRPQRVVLIHWDDLFLPTADGRLVATRRPFDNLDKVITVMSELADIDGVTLSLPRIWKREDPWRN